MAWVRYLHTELGDDTPPLLKPKRNEDSLEMLDRLGINSFSDQTIADAGFRGFDPDELFYSCLAKPWKGHPKHARVISDAPIAGLYFSVEMTESPQAAAGRKGGQVSSDAKREAARANIRKRWEKKRQENKE